MDQVKKKKFIAKFCTEKKPKKIYILCGVLILGIVGLLFIYKSIHSKIDIYSMNFNYSNDSNAINKVFTYNNQNVYYYGIENTFLCNQEQECFDLKEAIKNKRTSFSEIREYFNLKDGISLTMEQLFIKITISQLFFVIR